MKQAGLTRYGVMPIHLVASLLCLACLGAGWGLGLAPMMNRTQQQASLLASAQQAEADAAQSEAALTELTASIDELQVELGMQPTELLSATQINPLLAELAGWSEGHGLTITRTQAGRRQALTYYDYVPIELAGEGDYADYLAFLRQIDAQRGDMGVVDFAVSRMTGGQAVRFELSLAWYVLADVIEEGQATAVVDVP